MQMMRSIVLMQFVFFGINGKLSIIYSISVPSNDGAKIGFL
jgi:hypothetical protein